jgi:hypothetical protein
MAAAASNFPKGIGSEEGSANLPGLFSIAWQNFSRNLDILTPGVLRASFKIADSAVEHGRAGDKYVPDAEVGGVADRKTR